MRQFLSQLRRFSLDGAWVAVIVFLPITSFPLLSKLAGGTSVAPLSLLPLAWLGLFWTIPFILKKGKLPAEFTPLLFFCLVTLVSCAFAFFRSIPPYKGKTILGEEIQAIFTLIIGVSFYFITVSWLAGSEEKIVTTLRWINVSGIILLVWAGIQAFYIFFFHSDYPAALLQFQRFVSTRDLFIGRVTSFAFEPSWLAHQLNLFYLPFWLGATVSGFSSYRFRLWKIPIETILFGFGVGIVFIASRIGTLALLLIFALLGLYANYLLIRYLQIRVLSKIAHFSPRNQILVKVAIPVAVICAFFVLFVSSAVGLVYLLSRVDSRLAVLFEPSSLELVKKLYKNPYMLFNFLKFAERYVYWVVGWRIFNIYPFLGVGLGNAGFFFKDLFPAYSWSLPEVLEIYYRANFIPNIKSLWVRLLAETGILGFSAFVSWLYTQLASGQYLRRNAQSIYKLMGWAGIFILIALVIEGFSIDTFALPYLWISFGIVNAARVSAAAKQI
jgi:hypothetical protein